MMLRSRLLMILFTLLICSIFIIPMGCGDDDDDDSSAKSDDDDDDDTSSEEFLTLSNDVMSLKISLSPFGLQLSSDEKGVVAETLDFGKGQSLWYKRNFVQQFVGAFIDYEAIENGYALNYLTSEGIFAQVVVTLDTERSVKVTMSLEETEGWLFWGQDFALEDEEAVYGGMERIHWWYDWSEGHPKQIGSLNRRGEFHPMIMMATIAVISPFYHLGRGAGLYADSTFYGWFDIGHFVHDRFRFTFQTTKDRDPVMTYYLFYGPSHDQILDEYTDLTGRPFIPPRWAFNHMRWRDDHDIGDGILDGNVVNGMLAEDVNKYDELGFPIGNYMIDRPWTIGPQGFAAFEWDEVRLPNPDKMMQSLAGRGYRLFLWTGPWALGDEPPYLGYEAAQNGYFAPNQELHIDFTNPDAFEWFKNHIRDFSYDWDIRGWKLDRGDEDQPSFWWDTYWDGRSGAEVRNHYPVLYQQCVHQAMDEAFDGDFFMTFRSGYAGSQQYGVPWGGDTKAQTPEGDATDLGLRSAILSQLHSAMIGHPFWGSDTGGYRVFKDRDTFARWIEFSTFSGFMEIGGDGSHSPWDMPTEPNYDTEMIDIYRDYTTLHHDLGDYMYEYATEESVSGKPLTRPLVFDHPDDPNVRDMWDQYYFGYDILVAPIWKSGQRQRDVYIPQGRFVDYWNPSQVYTGPTTITVDVPLDQIQFFIREGTNVLGKVW